MKTTTLPVAFALGLITSNINALHIHGQDLSLHAGKTIPNEEMLGESKTTMSAAVEAYLMDKNVVEYIEEEFGNTGLIIMRRAYATKVFSPIWSKEGAADLIETVSDTLRHGLIADDIFSGELQEIIQERFSSISEETTARRDVELSLIWLRFARALSGELLDDGGMQKLENSPNLRYNIPYALVKSARGDDEHEILDMAPNAVQYQRLIPIIEKYRKIKAEGGWVEIELKNVLEAGDTDEKLFEIRQRLEAEGYIDLYESLTMMGDYYDEALVETIKIFQRHHGLEDDGVIGPETIDAMNESVDSKIYRIAEALNRWRAQGELGKRHIWANIPSYQAEAWNNGKMELQQKTIVGKKQYATPEFSDEVEYVVANPKWYLPVSIIRRQKLPKLRKDPGYAAKNGYDIYDKESGEAVSAYSVDWSEPGIARKYRFIQRAGDDNALGQLKIIFPNQYSVYLHGTPSEHLFEEAQRAFSSGCVRLENPIAMAKWIARHDEDLSRSEITEAIIDDDTQRMNIDEHVPVHITYITVTVDQEGQAFFWRDIYNKLDEGLDYIDRYEYALEQQRKKPVAL